MHRGLAPEALGDLFDLGGRLAGPARRPDPRQAGLAPLGGPAFVLQCPAGDRKIALLEHDLSITILLAEEPFPDRAIDVRGRVRMSRDDYRRRGREICRPYVEAFDPASPVEAYLSDEPGVIVEVDADVTTRWDSPSTR